VIGYCSVSVLVVRVFVIVFQLDFITVTLHLEKESELL